MKKINVVICGMPHTFREPAISLIESLQELGYESQVGYNIDADNKYVVSSDINLFIGAFHGFDFRRKIVLPKNALNIYFCTEQYKINTDKANVGFYNRTRDRFDVVLDMFKVFVDKPKKAKHRYCPVGWSPVWEENYDPTIKENIDVLHLGHLQIQRTKRDLNRKIVKMISHGKERDRAIQRAKINLSLQTIPTGYEWTQYRMLYVLGKRKFLMADEHVDYGPYEPDKHFKIFKNNSIGRLHDAWVGRPKKRRDFGQAAYEDIKENHKFTMYLERALKGIL